MGAPQTEVAACCCPRVMQNIMIQCTIEMETRMRHFIIGVTLLWMATACLQTAAGQTADAAGFAPVEQWRIAVAGGDAAALTKMFMTSPPPQIKGADGKDVPLDSEVTFWSGWKAKGLTNVRMEIVKEQLPQPNVHVLVAEVALSVQAEGTLKIYYVGMAQAWMKTGDTWSLAYVQRQNAARLRQPLEPKDLYPAAADAKKEIIEAIRAAAATHKRVLVVFGANWCYDCHVLEAAFHSPEISPTFEKSFELVHVDIGQADKNLDIAKLCDVPLDRGVPAIAVLRYDGKLLFSQKRGEFEAARSMAPEDILDFLNKWKPSSSQN
jgi:thioredoxin 1